MKAKCAVFSCLIWLISAEFNSDNLPQYVKLKYGKQFSSQGPYSGNVKTATKTKISDPSLPERDYNSPFVKRPGKFKYKGGCERTPPPPLNSDMLCSQFSGCKAECKQNYQFPNGMPQMFLVCNNGEWKSTVHDFTTIPDCQPVCLPNCQNNGICVAPNQCNCPENYSGPQCQFENKPCMKLQYTPMNSRVFCKNSYSHCTITCMDGHQFSDGSSIATLICKNGLLIPEKEKWQTIPDCEPICQPPCQNGGNCLSFNVCQCPQDFRGPQCQYRADSCNFKKLQFNGGYNCTGDSTSFSCSIKCAPGVKFEFDPAPLYTCTYDTGKFQPSPIPQCVFPENSQVFWYGNGSMEHIYTSNYTNYNVNSVPEGVKWQKPSEDIYINHSNIHIVPIKNYKTKENQFVNVEQKLPEAGVCFTWEGKHYKTFDGRVFSFSSKCAYNLITDSIDNTFSITIENSQCENVDLCHRIIKIYLQDKEYVMEQKDGKPILRSFTKILPIPGQFPGLRVEMSAHFVVLSLDIVGVKLKWDGKQLVQVEVKENLWSRTQGLCGKLDGNPTNDYLDKFGNNPASLDQFTNSWKVEGLQETCDELFVKDEPCKDEKTAFKFCQKLLMDQRFAKCHQLINVNTLMETCKQDYCNCKKITPNACACETLQMFVKICSFKGIQDLANWRDQNTCPMQCTGGRTYNACGSVSFQSTCGDAIQAIETSQKCVEGCYCPENTFLHDNNCIRREECPCRLRGKYFPPSATVPKDCNTCTCLNGQWTCTQVSCGARCSTIGDPHYVTFDGRKYDFMGQCSYYLVKTDNFTVEAENVACAGTISQAMNFPAAISLGLPSCTKTVTINFEGQKVQLKQGHQVVLNGQEIAKLPFKLGGIMIRTVSSIFQQVELSNGVQVWWDGLTRAYIDVPASFQQKTKGLCGTFNHNQKDDFLTPENDVEQAVIPFANKWKTTEKCSDIPDKLKSDPCTVNIQKSAIAHELCQKIKSNLFSGCHWYVDPEPFYQDCLYDMCSCEHTISKCLCPIIASYGQECARKDIKINWRQTVRECGIHCSVPGQIYQICGNSCTRSCSDISLNPNCLKQCVEGCNCPEGQTLDENGVCIAIGKCKCQHEGLDFHSGYKEIRIGSKGEELCTCLNGLWSCHVASQLEIKHFPKASDLKSLCSHTENMEFTTCEPAEPVTCKNMDSQDFYTATVCHAGCKCKDGYVLDTTTRKCILPTMCPCHHGGKSYSENQTVQNDCNQCKCQNGKWNCTNRQCPGECTAWGDSHFKTFDGRHYDYQGQCDYVLSKGSLNTMSYDLVIQNVPCSSLSTVSCSKSLTIRVKSGSEQETYALSHDKPIVSADDMKFLTVRQKGLFVIVEASDLGLTVIWDRGTRIYVKLKAEWIDKVRGLCGNFNGNEEDDFQTPSGGLTEVSVNLFGDSWKLQSYCPEATEITNTCEERPERKIWALKQCGVLKSSLFAPCHTQVPIDLYYEKCIFDTCACDQGGDCECLCTALAAYAQECNNRGVPIKWRSQQLCPMQCDERCAHYTPCISTCPIETCDNFLTINKLSKTCHEDNCIEGCSPKPCPTDEIYLNSSHLECVPRNICKPFCMEIDGIEYFEGDLIEEDDCHSCFCSRQEKICKGVPCSTTLTPISTTPLQHEETIKCKDGWTEWINQDFKKKYGKKGDKEPLPTRLIMNNLKGSIKCNKHEMIDIECRTVKTHLTPKETGLDVECSLENGLICKSANRKGRKCPDFEIRLKCQCKQLPTTTTSRIPDFCDVSRPNQEHPTDCHLFYQCMPGVNELIEKSCGNSMMYNPNTMVCDWPFNVVKLKPHCAEITTVLPETTLNINESEIPECPPGMQMDPCALKCDQMCLFYDFVVKQNGHCLNNNENKCESGCVSAEKRLNCPLGMMWTNNETCVSLHDCLCRSHDGNPVRPGIPYRESDCEICQCVNNFYSCQNVCTTIEKEEIKLTTPETSTIEEFPTSTVTPPPKCNEDNFINLIQGDQPLPDSAFSASSVLSSDFQPQFARNDPKITSSTGGSWSPKFSNSKQYLQINLQQQEPIYGILIWGSPLYDEYVTSFKLLYSSDGVHFTPYLNNNRRPLIFRGSVDKSTQVRHVFQRPFEAYSIRIIPQTWHQGISLKIELIGCKQQDFTVSPTTVDFCRDSMQLSDGQISVSSELAPKYNKKNVAITKEGVWQPLTNSPTEFVQFDFLNLRNLTGFETKGGPIGWVTVFNVKYSKNGIDWNEILDKNGKIKEFYGNYDWNTPHLNNFVRPINARYLQIVPLKWHKNIQLKVEIYGCYLPYPEIPTTETPQLSCNCPGISNWTKCHCDDNKWWDGENCVNRTECPCFIGHISYAIGTHFQKQDCSECVCKLGGIPFCTPKKCPKCPNNEKSTVTNTCKCLCQPCPNNTILCPTSQVCLNSQLWCNGIQDCPDDEVDCIQTTVQPVIRDECVVITCPKGYRRVKNQTLNFYTSQMITLNTNRKGIKGYNVKKPKRINIPRQPIVKRQICPLYMCVVAKPPPFYNNEEECPSFSCPESYIKAVDNSDVDRKLKQCPKIYCIPPIKDAICNITGRTFNTFDGIEFKYDICDHIVARDLEFNEWDIRLMVECNNCTTRILVMRHENDLITFYPDLSVKLNNFKYNREQINKIQLSSFTIDHPGNLLVFTSVRYGFWIIWDKQSNLKLGIVDKLRGTVDGLCGYFNGLPTDDKRKPDGNVAKSTVEFGDSWLVNQDNCDVKTCPLDIQNKAWDMCNQVKNRVFSECARVVDIDAFLSRCLEMTCNCLENGKDDCRCFILQSFVVDCLTAEPKIDVSDWRIQLDCPVTCPPPLVFHDCFQQKCEKTCNSITDPNVCRKLNNVCFPGCYCPPGYVKDKDTCIKPSYCRDCECNLLPHLLYITYDQRNFTINGNCVYVMSRDIEHKFQLLITNAPCKKETIKNCVGKVTILYKKHKIHVFHDVVKHKLKMIVDGELVNYQDMNKWLTITETQARHLKIVLIDALVQISVYYPSLGVSIKVPSHKYAGKLEGLCGDCDKHKSNDLRTSDGLLTENVNEFALSWLYDKLPGGQKREMCQNEERVCHPLPVDQDPCIQLLDMDKFGQCLPILDPSLFIDWCKKDTCNNHPELACAAIEAYARDCASLGFCLNWRTDLCPPINCPANQIYEPCGTNCPKTCDLNKKCPAYLPTEGCFCPKGQVLLNDTCVPENDCIVCDEEGHHPGDVWKKDKCTMCMCEGKNMKCDTKQCEKLKICQKGYEAIKLAQDEDQCCDQYVCIPEPTMGPTCEPPQQLQCAPDQIMKLDTKSNGCQFFICECKPLEDCPKLNETNIQIPIGHKIIIDKNDCCPRVKFVCEPLLCPKPEKCQQFYTLSNQTIPNQCCPQYKCEPPNKCIYESKFMSDEKGGERERTIYEQQKLLKEIDEEWNDGPCLTCKCSFTMNEISTYQAICTRTDCVKPQSDPDYELREVKEYDKCCPKMERYACKHNGKIYEIGAKWQDHNDFCTFYECTNTTNVHKKTKIVNCDKTCEFGYEMSKPAQNECCGICKPIGCVQNGQIYKIGEKWHSFDYCTNYICLNVNNSMQIQQILVNCPELPKDSTENYIYEIQRVPGECCKLHKPIACKVNNKTYNIGQSWYESKCKKITCLSQNNEIIKQVSMETCNKQCDKGWEYRESQTECCGKCIQIACIIDNNVKQIGESWTSSDNCTTFTCDNINGSFVVSSHFETCPELNCPDEDVYIKGCCKFCNITSRPNDKLCQPKAVSPSKTVGLLKYFRPSHGDCTNKEAIDNFTKCFGSCESFTSFNIETGNHDSVCYCCKSVQLESIQVELKCEDGHKWVKKIAVPSKCDCETCSLQKYQKEQPRKSFVKTG